MTLRTDERLLQVVTDVENQWGGEQVCCTPPFSLNKNE